MKITHYPNGGMCMSCTKLLDNCSHLPFCEMRVTKKDKDGCKMVLCTKHVKDSVSWREKVK